MTLEKKKTNYEDLLQKARYSLIIEKLSLNEFCEKFNCEKGSFQRILNKNGIIYNHQKKSWYETNFNVLENILSANNITENNPDQLANLNKNNEDSLNFIANLPLQRLDLIETQIQLLKNEYEELKNKLSLLERRDLKTTTTTNFEKEMDNIFYSRKKDSKYSNNDAMFCVRMPSEMVLELRQMFDNEKYSSVDGMYVMVRHYLNLYNLDKTSK
jgi:hypothetical protein